MPSLPSRRVMLWAPPRTLSTAVERVFIEHPKIQVVHEPFGVPHYWSSEAASTREAKDERTSITYDDVAEKLWRANLEPSKEYLFSKNLAYYFAPHCLARMSQMLGGNFAQVIHSFIIRHPAKAISSLYFKSCIDNVKTGYTHFDSAEAGFTAMEAIREHIEKQPGAPQCVIIDADDLLDDPEGVMRAYSAAVGLPFERSMLSWQPGPVKELESPWSGWTDDVVNSSGISRRIKKSSGSTVPAAGGVSLPAMDKLPLEVREAIEEAMPVYEKMYARRLRPPGSNACDHEAAGRQQKSREAVLTAAVEKIEVVIERFSTKRSVDAAPTAAPPPLPLTQSPKRRPIGASFSHDEVLFKFKTAHPPVPWAPPVGNERIISLSKPIRAVLTADILLSASLMAV